MFDSAGIRFNTVNRVPGIFTQRGGSWPWKFVYRDLLRNMQNIENCTDSGVIVWYQMEGGLFNRYFIRTSSLNDSEENVLCRDNPDFYLSN